MKYVRVREEQRWMGWLHAGAGGVGLLAVLGSDEVGYGLRVWAVGAVLFFAIAAWEGHRRIPAPMPR